MYLSLIIGIPYGRLKADLDTKTKEVFCVRFYFLQAACGWACSVHKMLCKVCLMHTMFSCLMMLIIIIA